MRGAGDQAEVLTWVVDRLCAETGGVEKVPPGPAWPSGGARLAVDLLSAADAALVAAVRRGLERVVATAGAAKRLALAEDAVRAALDGAEMVVRGELVCGNAARVPSLMPSFVFLVTLPVVDQDEALELSQRTAELVEEALEGPS